MAKRRTSWGNSENCLNAGVGIDVTDKILKAATNVGVCVVETCRVVLGCKGRCKCRCWSGGDMVHPVIEWEGGVNEWED